ncbi:alpha/beta hydrolase family protein [Blastopirellula marina]|uniref:Sialidase n=1 Tax=Blastopirellula marina TaxID=124 RepID=A0A2S8G916_9BACT|nr:dienelactone hydrolase family protein [Blastopirellula marina]PQO40948.1 sialidase [Blastopirellula marina]PTL45830.1 sialidase [Blastopirellula marina]
MPAHLLFVVLGLIPLFASLAVADEVPWLAEVTTVPEAVRQQHISPLGEIPSLDQWKTRRGEVVAAWKTFLGAYTNPDLPLNIEVIKTEELEFCTRTLIRYQAEPGRVVRAYLLVPPGTGQPKLPAIVAFHGTNSKTFDKLVGLDAEPARHMGLRLVKAGFVVLCPENFLWEASSYKGSTEAVLQKHPGSKGMAVMLADGMRAVNVLLAQPNVDPQRIGAYGHSLGAKEAMYLAALDDRIGAAVASEGGVEIGFSNWDAVWYLGSDVHNRDFNLSHHELLALIAPRPFLVLGGEQGRGCSDGERSWPAILSGQKIAALYGEPVRIGLYNHGEGHSLSWETGSKVLAWLETYGAKGE